MKIKEDLSGVGVLYKLFAKSLISPSENTCRFPLHDEKDGYEMY